MRNNPPNSNETDIIQRIDELNCAADKSIVEEDLESAKSYLEKVKLLLQEAENNQNPYQRGKVDYLVNLGAVYQYNCNESLQGLLEALQLLEQFSYPKGLIQTLNGIAWFYYVMGDFVNAKTYIERSILVAEDFDDPIQLYKTYNVAGVILSEINELDRAIKYLQFTIDYIENQKDNKDRGVVYNNLAMILAENGEYDKAEVAGLKGLEYSRQDELPLSEACVLDTLGMIYKGKGDLDQSIYYFTEAIKIFHSFKDVGLDFEPYLNLGEVLLIKGDLAEAEKNLQIAVEMVQRMPGSRLEYACYEKLAELYEKKGQYEKSIKFYKEFHRKKEKIFNQQNMQQIANLVSAHKVENAIKDAKILELTNATLRQEIETQKQQRAELERQATTDPLTGLINRRHFQTLSQFEFQNALKKGLDLSVAMLDVDHFKTINDRFGHAVGDQVLVRLAATINSAIRNEDLACRYGGEEFLLLIPRLDLEKTMAVANRVRMAVEEMAVDVQGEEIKITISAGVASLHPSDSSLDILINRADQTLLKAKTSGRNLVLPAE